jgi:hypothetical protein
MRNLRDSRPIPGTKGVVCRGLERAKSRATFNRDPAVMAGPGAGTSVVSSRTGVSLQVGRCPAHTPRGAPAEKYTVSAWLWIKSYRSYYLQFSLPARLKRNRPLRLGVSGRALVVFREF